MSLSADDILAADDLPREKVAVPEWGGDVYVRTMTGTERDAFEAEQIETNGSSAVDRLANIRARLLCRTLVAENGERLFSDTEADDLGKKSSNVLDRIFDVAKRLAGLSGEDVEDLAKN